MKLYFALASNKPDNEAIFESSSQNYLFSYHYYKTELQKSRIIDWGLIDNKDLFLDSGAFSAFTLKKEINIDEYIEYIKDLDVKIYANLDVIGDSEATVENELYMKSKDLTPLPVFHLGEPIYYLDRILNSNCSYFALGGMVQSQNLDGWLVNVWEHIYRKRPNIKVHGFGLTNINLMIKYPWYSCDSSSWASGVRFGRFSEWNPIKGLFIQKEVKEIFNKNGIDYENREPIINEKRQFIIKEQVNQFLEAEKWVNIKASSFDYNYLKQQTKLF
tara:strand:+ start:50 stop:871 length:822 start_codon:yes stop_codon:yes gene_type:complete